MRHVFGYDWMPSQTSQPLGSLDPEPLFRNSPGVPAMRAGLSRRLEPGAAASPLWRVQARLVPRGYIERHALWPRMTWNHQSNGLLPTLMPPNVRNLGWLNVIYLYIYGGLHARWDWKPAHTGIPFPHPNCSGLLCRRSALLRRSGRLGRALVLPPARGPRGRAEGSHVEDGRWSLEHEESTMRYL